MKFITFEGGEGAGKSTLMWKMHAYLTSRQLPVLATFAPGASQLGKVLRQLLLHRGELPIGAHSELFLFLADRSQHVEEVILPALAAGQIVLCDRFDDSTVAYQGGARGLGMTQVRRLCQFASHGLVPDLTLMLDLDPEIGLRRAQQARGGDRIESEALAFHRTLRRAFLQIADQAPERIRCLDARLSIEELFVQAQEALDALL